MRIVHDPLYLGDLFVSRTDSVDTVHLHRGSASKLVKEADGNWYGWDVIENLLAVGRLYTTVLGLSSSCAFGKRVCYPQRRLKENSSLCRFSWTGKDALEDCIVELLRLVDAENAL